MSPATGRDWVASVGFPRVSGDEPNWIAMNSRLGKFSPREWG